MGLKYRDGDGKPRPVPFQGIILSACCDCGLVHKHTYSLAPHPKYKGKLILMETVERANRATDGIRRGMAKDGTIVAVRNKNVYVIPRKINQKRPAKRFKVTIEPDND